MIKIIIKNEELDIDTAAVVTFKKSQQLNGIQDLYSFSNNFNLKDSAKNRRLLGINYLPNSKAKAMTQGYDVDVVLNGCIFLKRQKLKVQKETPGAIPVYLIFADNLFVASAKNILLSQINTGANYAKTINQFRNRNTPNNIKARTAAISAQDSSGLIVVEEVPILLNVKELVISIFTQMGWGYTGDILTDVDFGNYYTSPNVGAYGDDGRPAFDVTKTVYAFMLDVLETFNGYIEVSGSSKMVGFYLWKNIEGLKKNFVDYSDKFVDFEEYAFEGGLAKINTVSYSDSPDYYNGFFDNNKSIVEKTEYLKSNFGAGSLRLFADQEVNPDTSIPLRVAGETTEPKVMNLFRFEEATSVVRVYYLGVANDLNVYKAYSPNILELWQLFHQAYCKNIALPTIGQLKFRYDAIFLSEFKMGQVFFIKQLATYWLPMELNFTTKKDGVKVKAIMIEKTPLDVPIVFDQNLSVGFYGETFILDVFALYSAANISPAQTMIITAADLTKNEIWVNGTQVLAFPTSITVAAGFEFKVVNIEAENIKSNSDVLFQFVSQEGGVSRVGKINVAHNGYANFLSEFRSELDTVYTFGENDTNGLKRRLNYSAKITTALNIADTFAPAIGDVPYFAGLFPRPPVEFKALEFDRACAVTVELTIDNLHLYCSNRGGKAEARTKIFFQLWKNGVAFMPIYSAGVIDRYRSSNANIDYNNVSVIKTFNVSAGDVILLDAYLDLSEEDRIGSGTMNGSVSMTNVVWRFKVSEQL